VSGKEANKPFAAAVAWEFCWFSLHRSFRWYISSEFFDSLQLYTIFH